MARQIWGAHLGRAMNCRVVLFCESDYHLYKNDLEAYNVSIFFANNIYKDGT